MYSSLHSGVRNIMVLLSVPLLQVGSSSIFCSSLLGAPPIYLSQALIDSSFSQKDLYVQNTVTKTPDLTPTPSSAKTNSVEDSFLVSPNEVEEDFLTFARNANYAQKLFGSYVDKHCHNPALSAFASTTIGESDSLNAFLIKFEKGKDRFALTSTLNPEDAATNLEFRKLFGIRFEDAYINWEETTLNKIIYRYQLAAKESTNLKIKKFASDAVPFFEKHLKEIHNLKAE